MIDTVESVIPVVRDAVAGVMTVEDVMVGGQASAFRSRSAAAPAHAEPLMAFMLGAEGRMDETLRVRGRLLVSAEEAYNRIAERLRPLGRTPLLRKAGEGREAVVLVMPGLLRPARQRVAVAGLLFALTALSCLFVGAQLADGTLLPANLLHGAPYAASLLAILLAHEFGHYLTARSLGAPASLPYFIPLPFGLGTLGAVINMTVPPRNRRHLLAVGAAGPLAGLLVAIPILWLGLNLSHVEPLQAGVPYQMEGNSLAYLLLKFLHFGQLLPSGGAAAWMHPLAYIVQLLTGRVPVAGGYDVLIHPVAYAGWAGLLVTALNLIPAGQLDGGHIFYAVFGERAANVMLWVVLLGLAALSFLWLGWLLWVALVFFFGRLRVPLLDEVTQLGDGQRVLGFAMLIIFVLVFTPVPMSVVP